MSSQLRNYAATAEKDYGDLHPASTGGSPATPHETRDVTKFQELIDHEMVHSNVVEQITKRMGHHTMTDVQSLTINQGLQSTDM